ncbi:MAG: hypothetical protein CV090_14890 [Nitrospira sp. WS238]|nr:hypothetical protein [Nitrospira sp. WS238]
MTLRNGLLVGTLTIASWLIAHSMNAYMADALLPEMVVEPAVHDSSSPGSPSSDDAMQLAQSILASGLFVLPPGVLSLDPSAPNAQKAAPPPTPPLELVGKLKLLGTAIGNQIRPSAAIENLSDHTQQLYSLEEEVEGFGHVTLITREGVTITQGNRNGYLPLDQMGENAGTTPVAPPVTKRATAQTIIDRRQLKQNLADVSKLLTEARAMPYYNVVGNNGALDGWMLTQIKPKSILDQLGIQDRDIMMRINGTSVTDPNTLLRLLQEIQYEQKVKVDLLRNGEKQTLAYEIR